MATCICDNCIHLRDYMTDDGEALSECEYGAPTNDCADCDLDGCDAECPHFEAIGDAPEPASVVCSVCGKVMEQYGGEAGDGPVYCVTCYLKKENGGTEA